MRVAARCRGEQRSLPRVAYQSPTTAASTTCAVLSRRGRRVRHVPTPQPDPPTVAERREDLQRLVTDVRRLPEQQRSALLMRELQGMTYEERAVSLDVTVAGGEVAARAGPEPPRRLRRGARHRVRLRARRSGAQLRSRRAQQRPRPPAPPRLLGLPRIPRRPARRAAAVRRARPGRTARAPLPGRRARRRRRGGRRLGRRQRRCLGRHPHRHEGGARVRRGRGHARWGARDRAEDAPARLPRREAGERIAAFRTADARLGRRSVLADADRGPVRSAAGCGAQPGRPRPTIKSPTGTGPIA